MPTRKRMRGGDLLGPILASTNKFNAMKAGPGILSRIGSALAKWGPKILSKFVGGRKRRVNRTRRTMRGGSIRGLSILP